MTDYERLRDFWNAGYGEPSRVEGKWVADETFNRVVSAGLEGAGEVLDFGCGSGWGLFEMYYTGRFAKGVGMDPSPNAIDFCRRCTELSDMANLEFLCGDERLLAGVSDRFDFIFTANTLDVVPQEVCDGIMQRLSASLKPGRRMVVCLNPEFSDDDFKTIGMQFKGRYGYKDGIFRCNRMSRKEWADYLGRYLDVVEFCTFGLSDAEKRFPPRMMFVLGK